MQYIRLRILLEEPEYAAIEKMAEQDFRNPTEQARFILRQELERRGLLPLAGPGQVEVHNPIEQEPHL